MVLKKIDSKEEEIKTLQELLAKSASPAQKKLIAQDLSSVKNGYASEKDNAYYLDFAFQDNKRSILLHDIRIEHNGKTAQFDHILVSPFGITLLESKSSTGELEINSDNSISIKYGATTRSFPNPIEQNNRHRAVIERFLSDKITLPSRVKVLGGIRVDSKVLIHPSTNVINKTLPDGFARSDSYATLRNKEIDNLGAVSVFLTLASVLTKDIVNEIAEVIIASHTPVSFDYTKKYKIGKQTKKHSCKTSEMKKDICPRCKEGTLVARETKKVSSKYPNSSFLGCSRYPKCRYTEPV